MNKNQENIKNKVQKISQQIDTLVQARDDAIWTGSIVMGLLAIIIIVEFEELLTFPSSILSKEK